MSDNQESDETLLPDDADRKIEQLMAALKQSEREMMGIAPSDEETPEAEAEETEPQQDFLSDGEGDFVDLDADQLDNSTDKLQLDESDTVEEELLEQLTATVTPPTEELQAQAARIAQQASADAERRAREANELARARLDELEEKLAAVAAKPLPAPNYREARGGLPGWLSPTLSLLAVAMGGAALWLTLNAPTPASAPVAVMEIETIKGVKGEVAALRERLALVEKQVETGSDEAIAMLDRMQAILARMERKIVGAIGVNESPAPSAPAVAAAQAQPGTITAPPVMAMVSEESAPVPESGGEPATSVEGKVFVEGWAVNLRSFYHRVDAERLMQRYQGEGIDAEVREIPKGSATWYRVRVMGFDSKKAANAFIDGLSEEQGREMAWPSHYAGYVDG